MPAEHDTAFALPAVDDDPETEAGVLLMGLGAERLLAGLGVAGATDDPARVSLLVDQQRHGVRAGLDDALAAGARRWRTLCPALAAAAPAGGVPSAALRSRWVAASAEVSAATTPRGRAEHVYLTACWLRGTEIEETIRGIPELPA